MTNPAARRVRASRRPVRRPALAGLALALAVAPLPRLDRARAADPQPYVVDIARTGNAPLDAALTGSSQLESLRRTAPVGPFALVGRAQADQGRLRTALESFGYYQPSISIQVDGHPLDDPDLPDAVAAIPKGQDARVTVRVQTGPLFHLGQVQVHGDLPADLRAKLGVGTGDPAVAAKVLAGSDALRTGLQEQGHALATVSAPVAILRPDSRTLDVTYTVVEGPRVDIGPITLEGLQRMDPGFVRRRLLVHQGELYQPSRIEAARTDLAGLGVFSGVQARAADHLDAAGQIPLTFDLQERPLHAVTLGGAYSTDLGASLTATWSDRNLFGQAEQLNLSASLLGAGGTAVKGLAYNATAQFLKPDFLAPRPAARVRPGCPEAGPDRLRPDRGDRRRLHPPQAVARVDRQRRRLGRAGADPAGGCHHRLHPARPAALGPVRRHQPRQPARRPHARPARRRHRPRPPRA